jgi:hypothetical protein
LPGAGPLDAGLAVDVAQQRGVRLPLLRRCRQAPLYEQSAAEIFGGAGFEPQSDADEVSLKFARIRSIQGAGLQVVHVIHRHMIPDYAVSEVEAALIDAFPGLSNGSGRAWQFGTRTDARGGDQHQIWTAGDGSQTGAQASAHQHQSYQLPRSG